MGVYSRTVLVRSGIARPLSVRRLVQILLRAAFFFATVDDEVESNDEIGISHKVHAVLYFHFKRMN